MGIFLAPFIGITAYPTLYLQHKEFQKMAIVLALLIVGWLVAFALGSQSGFDNQPEAAKVVSQPTAEPASSTYREPASVS